MKILHIYSKNLDAWSSIIDPTCCCINGYSKFTKLADTINNYNIKDCLGIILHETTVNEATFKKLEILNATSFFVKFNVVVVGDDATASLSKHCNKYRNLNIYACDSDNGTISDTDINNIMTLLYAMDESIYDIPINRYTHNEEKKPVTDKSKDADFVLSLLHKDSLLSKGGGM